MAFRLTPRYEDLIDEPIESIEAILQNIPTTVLLFTVAAMNERIENGMDEKGNIVFFLRRLPTKFQEVRIKIDKFYSKNHGPISIFSKLHLCRLAIEALKQPNLDIRDSTPEEDWQIFRAYMVLINQYNDSQEIVLKQEFNENLDTFNNLTWPTIAEQYQFLNSRNPTFDIVKTVALVDELLESGQEEAIKKYSEHINMPVLDMVSNIYGIANHKQILDYDGWKTPSYFVRLNNTNTNVFSNLLLDIENINKESNFDDNYLAIKKYPLVSYDDDVLVIVNRQFLRNKIYNGFIFDFFSNSGIKQMFKRFDVFKSFIGKEVAEKRLFKSLIKSIYPKDHQIKIFSEKDSHPDGYIRIHNRIFLIEFKDYMMSSRVINSMDVDAFKEEVDKKFISNEKGKPKGISQLANQIEFLKENEYEFDKIYSIGLKKEKIEIYPILVYTDYQYSIPGINDYLTKHFQTSISTHEGFKEISPPTMININFLFKYANYIAKNRLDKIIKSYYRKKRKRENVLSKKPTPDNWIQAKLSFDDMGPTIDFSKSSNRDILKIFMKNINFKNLN
jgi:hypothetical protein